MTDLRDDHVVQTPDETSETEHQSDAEDVGLILPGRVAFDVAHDAHDLIPTITSDPEVAPFVKDLLEEGKEVMVESGGGNKIYVTFANGLEYIDHHRKGVLAVGLSVATGVVGLVYFRQRKRGKR
ncbi:MAG: hypothetical protein JOZ39_07295 [Chloroflexi bacterium]|nr:hypothetical protein [Chloroflexota bacterium]